MEHSDEPNPSTLYSALSNARSNASWFVVAGMQNLSTIYTHSTCIQLGELCGEVITDEGCWDFLSSSMAPLILGNSIPGVPAPPNVIPAFIEVLAACA